MIDLLLALSGAHGLSVLKLNATTNLGVLYTRMGWGHYSEEQTRNTLDCDQSNYSSRIVFSHMPIEFGQIGISAIRSADLENPTIEPNMKWIGRPLAEIWSFEISPNVRLVGRSVAGRSSIYTSSYTDLIYSSSLRWNVAREE